LYKFKENIKYFFSLVISSNFQFLLLSFAGKLFDNTDGCREPMKWKITKGGSYLIVAEHRLFKGRFTLPTLTCGQS